MNLSDKVNLLQGTASTPEFSRGNTLPIVARPWGMHHWTLQTAEPPWLFHPEHRTLQGIRLTHRPSPWMTDYGSMLISAFTGNLSEGSLEQPWKIEEALLQPARLAVELPGVRIEMTPSNRGALFVFTRLGSAGLRIRFHFEGEHEIRSDLRRCELDGVSRDHQNGVAGNFGLRWVACLNAPAKSFHRTRNGGYLVFPDQVERVELGIAGSFLNRACALSSYERELAGATLSVLAREGEEIWDALLGRIDVDPIDERQERTFYSCLYRALLFPRFCDEINPNGLTVHYSPYDGHVHEGPLCADNGFWDTHRTLYPLLALAYPDVLRRMLEGWLNACIEAGWTPKWSNPGAHDCMIGTHFNAVVAEAIARGIKDWDVERAFQYLWKDATQPGPDGRFGREDLQAYLKFGYVPADVSTSSVSRTLDYCYDDYCVCQVAEYLGESQKAALLRGRPRGYRHLFDASTGFMRPRLANGEWAGEFAEFAWGGAYVEGGPWQHAFHVPHDPFGLARLHGGAEALCRKLEKMLSLPPLFETGSYGREIHEMTEMARARFGQYAHSNQPVHNYLFLFALMGKTDRTEFWVRRVTEELYGPDYFPGDEDNGEMSAWYVLAVLGLFPCCPGSPELVRYTPLVHSAQIGEMHFNAHSTNRRVAEV